MERCITCEYWLISSEPFEKFGFCIRPCLVAAHDLALTEPGHRCEDYEPYETTGRAMQLDLAKEYLIALIGRERAEFGTIAWEAFCDEISELYKKLTPQMQLNTHDAFRLFMKRPNRK